MHQLALLALLVFLPKEPGSDAAHLRGGVDTPILLIHGLGSDGSTWNDMVNLLVDQGLTDGGSPEVDHALSSVVNLSPGDVYTPNFSDWDSDPFPSKNLSFEEQGWELREIIAAVLAANPGSSTVKLVGHSMGGLAARAYLQGLALGGLEFRNDVEILITVGTPHHGSFLVETCQALPLLCSLLNLDANSVAVAELEPGSDALLRLANLVDNPLPAAVQYHAVVGLGSATIGDTGSEPGDGIVTQDSQDPGIVAVPWNILPFTVESCGVFVPLHNCETSDPEVTLELRDLLIPPIFVSGFESGDTSDWTSTTP